jgi:FlaA1/EpsC-like NDP-sugar epimerase
VVGFLDDDRDMRDRSINGVRILGPSSSIGEIVERERVEEVVLTTNQHATDLMAECRRRGVTLKDVGAFFRSQIDGEAAAAEAVAR